MGLTKELLHQAKGPPREADNVPIDAAVAPMVVEVGSAAAGGH